MMHLLPVLKHRRPFMNYGPNPFRMLLDLCCFQNTDGLIIRPHIPSDSRTHIHSPPLGNAVSHKPSPLLFHILKPLNHPGPVSLASLDFPFERH